MQAHTELLYMQDMFALTSNSKIVGISQDNERTTLILDRTVFYPQGGGQPFDQGTIENDKGLFQVREVRFIDGLVKHIGQFERGSFTSGDIVHCHVDGNRRFLNSRLHSAGHLIDLAIQKLALGWVPSKGYHFPDGPYVEYRDALSPENMDQVKSQIEQACRELVGLNPKTTIQFMTKAEMEQVCQFVPDNIPADKPARIVMFGDKATPCGGTHVASLADLGSIQIRKLKTKGNIVRVSYELTNNESSA